MLPPLAWSEKEKEKRHRGWMEDWSELCCHPCYICEGKDLVFLRKLKVWWGHPTEASLLPKRRDLEGVSRGCCPGTARRCSEQQKYSQIVVQMLPTVKVVPWRDWMALAAALPRASCRGEEKGQVRKQPHLMRLNVKISPAWTMLRENTKLVYSLLSLPIKASYAKSINSLITHTSDSTHSFPSILG